MRNKTVSRSFVLTTVLLILSPLSHAEDTDLDKIKQEGIERISENQSAQREITQINDETRKLLDEYQNQLKLVQGLETYVSLLDQQLADQETEISDLQRSITDVAVMERQILPFLTRMIDTLEQFVSADTPFLPQERAKRATRLREMLSRSDVTVAEKSRRVFEAYQIENDYGRTIESYTGKLELAGATYDAEFLRVGRVSLLYKTVGTDQVGKWDADSGEWQALDKSPWLRLIKDGIQVARQEVAPQLIHIPVTQVGNP